MEAPEIRESVTSTPTLNPVKEGTNTETLSASSHEIAAREKDEKSGKKSPELVTKLEIENDEQVDMSGMISNIKIDFRF